MQKKIIVIDYYERNKNLPVVKLIQEISKVSNSAKIMNKS